MLMTIKSKIKQKNQNTTYQASHNHWLGGILGPGPWRSASVKKAAIWSRNMDRCSCCCPLMILENRVTRFCLAVGLLKTRWGALMTICWFTQHLYSSFSVLLRSTFVCTIIVYSGWYIFYIDLNFKIYLPKVIHTNLAGTGSSNPRDGEDGKNHRGKNNQTQCKNYLCDFPLLCLNKSE